MDRPTPRRRSRTGERGFTLLELLVVLTIAGLILAVAGPRLVGSIARARLHASADAVATILKATRSRAMKTAQTTELTIASDQRHYRALGKDYSLPANQRLSSEAQLRASDGFDPALQFFPNGSSNGGKIIISGGGRAIAIDVDWLTGRVSLGE